MSSINISRRSVLRGLGAALAIPSLESFGNTRSTNIPLRMGFTYIPNGVILEEWKPKEFGKLSELPTSLKPLQSHTNDFQVMSGLNHTKAYANGDGGGDHARANATFLTGCQAKKTAGKDIKIIEESFSIMILLYVL